MAESFVVHNPRKAGFGINIEPAAGDAAYSHWTLVCSEYVQPAEAERDSREQLSLSERGL